MNLALAEGVDQDADRLAIGLETEHSSFKIMNTYTRERAQ